MTKKQDILHPVVICQVMINFAASLGVDKETCLLGTGISESTLQDNDALIPRSQEMRLVENLMLALPDTPDLGFQLGLQYHVSTFGIWGFALRTCRTLRDAARVGLRYLPLSTSYCQISLVETEDQLGMRFNADSVPQHLRQFIFERDLATGLNIANELSLTGMPVISIDLQGPPAAYGEALEQITGVKPRFNRPQNQLMMNGQAADIPLPTYNPSLVRMLDDQCQQLLSRQQTGGVTGQVHQQLLGELGLAASLDEVAATLAMSPRSLRRKLEQEGTSFRALVEQERHQLAQQLLLGSNMKLDELAIKIGYNDTASFTRAFRRWQGCSPGEFRKSKG